MLLGESERQETELLNLSQVAHCPISWADVLQQAWDESYEPVIPPVSVLTVLLLGGMWLCLMILYNTA